MEEHYNIEHIDPHLLYGNEDLFLQFIEKEYNCELFARGTQITIRGTKDQIAQLIHLFNELTSQIQKKGGIELDDVKLTVTILKKNPHSNPELEDYRQHIILQSPSGPIKPKTENQFKLYEATQKHDITFSIGPAGTGKTYLSVAIAASLLKQQRIKRIVLVRPVVEAGENLGFLPGDFREKINPYLQPLLDALGDFFPREQLQRYLETETIEIAPLAYMRGRTLNNAFVILDEAQNATRGQMKMFLTRLGRSSKIVINGDDSQIDLSSKKDSGLIHVQHFLKDVKGISFVYFDPTDVVRHPLVQRIIEAYEVFEEKPEHVKSNKNR